MKLLHNNQALIVGTEPFDLNDYPDLRVIGCNMTGTEHLPWDEINRRGIKVFSLRGESFLSQITSTAEHTIGLMIALMRNYKTALNGPYEDREVYKGHTLRFKEVHIIGFGRIGKQVEGMISGLGMSPTPHIGEADVVTLHIPLSGNEGFFTKEMFKQMRPESYFVNTSRSGVVEKGALLWALENGIIAGAAVDFIDDPDLVSYAETHNNLILTNHQGGNTFEDQQRTEDFIIKKVTKYLNQNGYISG